MEGTYEKVKERIKKTAEKTADSAEEIADPDKYKGSNNANENRENEKGGREPMNPEDIAEHEPTAVNRDKNQGASCDPV